MAIEPYRPKPEQHYRDDLDRELDKKIDSFFHRWNWKLARFIRRGLLVAFVIWVLVNIIPGLIGLLSRPGGIGPLIIQFLFIGGYLFFFIGFQFFLMYKFMARTRIYWVNPGETGVGLRIIAVIPRCWKRLAVLSRCSEARKRLRIWAAS